MADDDTITRTTRDAIRRSVDEYLREHPAAASGLAKDACASLMDRMTQEELAEWWQMIKEAKQLT